MKIVTAAILHHQDQVLIARRHAGDRLAGKWEFPGGKVEPGESLDVCLERELREEFGIQVVVGDFFMQSTHRYYHGAIDLRAYFVSWEPQPLEPAVHDEIKWVSPGNLLEHDLLPADIPIAEARTRTAPSSARCAPSCKDHLRSRWLVAGGRSATFTWMSRRTAARRQGATLAVEYATDGARQVSSAMLRQSAPIVR